MSARGYLARLQREAREGYKAPRHGSPDFHYGLRVWVDDNSSIAKVLNEIGEAGE